MGLRDEYDRIHNSAGRTRDSPLVLLRVLDHDGTKEEARLCMLRLRVQHSSAPFLMPAIVPVPA